MDRAPGHRKGKEVSYTFPDSSLPMSVSPWCACRANQLPMTLAKWKPTPTAHCSGCGRTASYTWRELDDGRVTFDVTISGEAA